MYRPFLVPTRTATFFAMTPSLSARECRDHVHDVAFLAWSVLPPQQAGVVLVDEQRHVRSQFAVFVAEAPGRGRGGVDQRPEGFPGVGCGQRALRRPPS